jgi:hypothetical protein
MHAFPTVSTTTIVPTLTLNGFWMPCDSKFVRVPCPHLTGNSIEVFAALKVELACLFAVREIPILMDVAGEVSPPDLHGNG